MENANLEKVPTVDKWLNSVGERTRAGYVWHMVAFMKWVEVNGGKFKAMSPDELVGYVLDGRTREVNEILDLKKGYLLTLTARAGHKRNANKAIMSFFTHNRAPLPRDDTLILRGDSPKVEGTLSPEDVKRVVMASNVLYQSAFLVMLGSGMGQNEFIGWSDTGLEELRAQSGADVVRVQLHGRKGDKNEYSYHTFIAGDALKALRRYLGERGTQPGPIFVNSHGEPLTQVALYRYWTRKLVRLGIKAAEGWTGTNTHEMRDVYRTLWRRSGVPVEFGEFFMGHRESFDRYGYDKTSKDEDEMRKRYLEALPWLNLLSETKPFKLVREDEVSELRKQLEAAKAGQSSEVAELKRQQAEDRAEIKDLRADFAEVLQALRKNKG